MSDPTRYTLMSTVAYKATTEKFATAKQAIVAAGEMEPGPYGEATQIWARVHVEGDFVVNSPVLYKRGDEWAPVQDVNPSHLVMEVHDILVANTESLAVGDLATDLPYLYVAILRGSYVELYEPETDDDYDLYTNTVKLLRHCFPEQHPVWLHVQLVPRHV